MSARPVPLHLPQAGSVGEAAVRHRFAVPRLRGWLLFTTLVVAGFLLLIYSRTALDRSAFDLAELESSIATAESQYWELRLEVARLQSPDLIEARAADLGLVYPDPAELRRITVAGAAAADSEIDERWTELKALLSSQP
jgi:hypothetical protein